VTEVVAYAQGLTIDMSNGHIFKILCHFLLNVNKRTSCYRRRIREMTRKKTAVKTLLIIAVVILFPVATQAGSLDPGGPPVPTMKTLDEIPPTWSQILPASERFVLVLKGTGVLDKETGLVWERSPSQSTHTWSQAQDHCYDLDKGGRKGWHLPTVEQLASLIDTSESNPALPNGNRFNNVQSPQCVVRVFQQQRCERHCQDRTQLCMVCPRGAKP
jgi:hypothetical protein